MKTETVHLLCRVFFVPVEAPIVDVWEHELTSPTGRSGAEWGYEHLSQCYTEKDLRELLGVPAEGDFEVIFKATLAAIPAHWIGTEMADADESLEVSEVRFRAITPEEVGEL